MKPWIIISCILFCLSAYPCQAYGYGPTSASLKSSFAGTVLIAENKTGLRGSLRANSAWISRNTRQEVRQTSAILDSAATKSELNSKLRGLTPHATALLGPMGINRFDLMQGMLFGNMGKKYNVAAFKEEFVKTIFFPRLQSKTSRAQNPVDYFKPVTESPAALPQTPTSGSLSSAQWDAWLSPIAAFERYDAKNDITENASSATIGLVAGTVRHYARHSIGFTGFFMRSAPEGGGWTADVETYGMMAGLDKPDLKLGPLTPRMRLGIGYAYSEIKQKRDDILGFSHSSFPGQHGIRLAASLGQSIPLSSWLDFSPSAGLDYTYIHQNAYSEGGKGLRLVVGSSSLQSVRPYLAGEITVRAFESLTLSTKAIMRHEMGDRTLALNSEIYGTPLNFSSKGYQYSRNSGSGGFHLNWQASDDLSLGAHYNIFLGDRYPGHYAHAPAAMSYEGESYDGSSGNGGLMLNWQLAKSVSLNATYEAIFHGDAPGSQMNAVITWEF